MALYGIVKGTACMPPFVEELYSVMYHINLEVVVFEKDNKKVV